MNDSKDFLRTIVEEDLKSGKNREIITRFPPEPNGFPHIGHAKSICINFGIASDYQGHCNLRMDDTNPTKEDTSYVEALKDAVAWLGFDWGDKVYFTSDYFSRIYDYAKELIKMDKAYVDSLTEEEIREYRGTVTEAGKRSKYAERSIEENLDLFEKMKNGEFKDGEHVLRAKIDMSAARETHFCIVSDMHITLEREMSGLFTRCMILRTVCLTILKVFLTLFVHWSLKTTVIFMIGYLILWD